MRCSPGASKLQGCPAAGQAAQELALARQLWALHPRGCQLQAMLLLDRQAAAKEPPLATPDAAAKGSARIAYSLLSAPHLSISTTGRKLLSSATWGGILTLASNLPEFVGNVACARLG